MKVRCKKMLSAAVVSAILAAQTLMPVAAASGTIDADMSTKSPVLRVQVPTKMAVSVNEFAMGDEGSQITSGVFDMKNMSEIPVNVKVTSEAKVGANTTLVSSKKAAEDSTDSANPAMWLAAVAAVNNNSGNFEYATGSGVTVADLEGTEDNITVFGTKNSGNMSTAVQNFYLKEATAATYKGIIGSDIGTAGIGGADFYELIELQKDGSGNIVDDGSGTTITDPADVIAAAAGQDIYVVTAAIASGAQQTVAKYEKGNTTFTGTAVAVYKLASAPTETENVIAGSKYVYIGGAAAPTDGDEAAFRYIGALSKAKSGWSTTDLEKVTIKYDITGISTTAYKDVAANNGLTYGYKKEDAVITIDTTGLITMNTTTAQLAALYVNDGTTDVLMNSTKGSWGDTWNDASTVLKFQLNETWVNYAKGKTIVAKLELKDGTIYESAAVAFPE